jgi:restriction system protein
VKQDERIFQSWNMAEESSSGISGLVVALRGKSSALRGQSIVPATGKLTMTGMPADLRVSVSDEVGVSDGVRIGLTESSDVQKISELDDEEVVIQSALVGFTGPNVQPQIVRSVAIPWAEIIRGLQQDSDFLHKIKPRRLEELIAEAYEREGYKDVILTPHSADKGRDVIVSATLPGMGTVKIVDQVKRYKRGNKVTAEEVRALAGVLSRDQDVSKGIVTTTSDFAPGIQEEFKAFFPSRLELKNGKALIEWLQELRSTGTA